MLYAENKLTIINNSFTRKPVDILSAWQTTDWILDVKVINSNQLIIVTAHNSVSLWENIFCNPFESRKIHCTDQCVSFCAFIYHQKSKNFFNDTFIISGTAFGQILIWIACSGVILHRLKAHEGTIFSLDIIDDQLATVSDDKSLKLWSHFIDKPLCLKTIKAHTDRIFVTKLFDNHLITIGEDYCMKLWDKKEGTNLLTINNQFCTQFRSIDYQNDGVLVTGSSNSAISMINLEHYRCEKTVFDYTVKVKKLFITKRNYLITILDDRSLLYRGSFICTLGDSNSIILSAISLCRQFLITLNRDLDTKVFQEESEGVLKCITSVKLNNDLDTCFGVFFVSDNKFVVYGEWSNERYLKLYSLNGNELQVVGDVKFRYGETHKLSNLNYLTVCILIESERFLVVGDRKSNLYLFDLKLSTLVQVLYKIHSYVGITAITYDSNYNIVSTIGRDSRLKKFLLTKSQLVELDSDKLPFSWPCTIFNSGGEMYIAGFEGVNFLIFNHNRLMIVFRENCKGAHRAYDVAHLVSHDIFNLSYASRDQVVSCTLSQFSNRVVFLKDGYHSDEINDIVAVPLRGSCNLLISASEDTYLRFSVISGVGDNTLLFSIKNHLSSIRCLTMLDHLFVSGGGRAQFILWSLNIIYENDGDVLKKVVPRVLVNSQLPNDAVEFRIMATILIPGYFLVFGCSDGSVYFYKYIEGSQFELCFSYCFGVCITCVIEYNGIVIFGNIVGCVTLWDLNDAVSMKNTFKRTRIHQSAVLRSLVLKSGYLITCGDDNAVIVSILRGSDCLPLARVETEFCAQINGLCYLNGYLVCCTKNQHVIVYNLQFPENDTSDVVPNIRFQVVDNTYVTNVSNVNGMSSMANGNQICIYGYGFEICRTCLGWHVMVLGFIDFLRRKLTFSETFKKYLITCGEFSNYLSLYIYIYIFIPRFLTEPILILETFFKHCFATNGQR